MRNARMAPLRSGRVRARTPGSSETATSTNPILKRTSAQKSPSKSAAQEMVPPGDFYARSPCQTGKLSRCAPKTAESPFLWLEVSHEAFQQGRSVCGRSVAGRPFARDAGRPGSVRCTDVGGPDWKSD